MKCFEKLVLRHIKAALPPTLDQHQFAYRANRSTEDAINIALHTALSHLEHPGTYVRLLFLDFSSAFNTIIPSRMETKLLSLGVNQHMCNWIKNFLTNHSQMVRMTINTGAPQGCVLSPLLFSLYTYDCTPIHSTNTIIKFADDTTVVGLIHNGDEAAYRDEVCRLTDWCFTNNLALNISRTREMIVNFRKQNVEPAPLHISGVSVERVGTYISQDLTWTPNITALVKKSQQRLYFLRTLRRMDLSQKLLLSFYHCSIESILTYSMLVWFVSCTAADRKALQRVIKSAQQIIGTVTVIRGYLQNPMSSPGYRHCQGLIPPWSPSFHSAAFWEALQVFKNSHFQISEQFLPKCH
ncbi:hypothetical protein LDENG_00267500 [Lucifuga dentata]|nr:hypothetical protein LDENG_00267500 [Lucifuga dentata]